MDNALYTKLNNGNLSDVDIKGMEWYIAQYPNDDKSTEYRAIIEKYKNKTNEKKDAYRAKKQTAESKFNSWDKNRSVIAKKAEWAKLLKERHPITVFFELNEFGNPVRKKGM